MKAFGIFLKLSCKYFGLCCLNEEGLYCSFWVYIFIHIYPKEIQLSPGLYVSFSLRCMLPYIFLFCSLHWLIFIIGFNSLNHLINISSAEKSYSPYYCVLPDNMKLPLCLPPMNGTYIPYCVPVVVTVILYWHFLKFRRILKVHCEHFCIQWNSVCTVLHL